MSLRETFGQDFAGPAFRREDGDEWIVGKFGNVSQAGDLYDLWLVGPGVEPLGERKIAAMLKKLPQELGFTRLEGEAYARTPDPELVRLSAPIMGIKKRRKMSPEAAARNRENLRKAREAQR